MIEVSVRAYMERISLFAGEVWQKAPKENVMIAVAFYGFCFIVIVEL